MEYSVMLYEVEKDATCIKCGHKGAIQFYGKYYPRGLGSEPNLSKSLEKYKHAPYMDFAIGFGGTIPYHCTNCGNTGLIDMDGLEGYHKAFTKREGNKE